MHLRILLSVLSLLMYSGIAYAAPFAYIANSADDTVSVIDTATNAVSTITVGNGPYGVSVNPIGGRVYVSNQIGKNISVIDTLNNSVTSIPTSGLLAYAPSGLAVNSAGTRLFVADGAGDSLTVYDVATKASLGTIAFLANQQPDGVAVGPKDGSGNYKVYVTCFGAGLLKVISANDTTATSGWGVADVTVGAGPKGVAVTPNGTIVYVANWDSNTVTKVNVSLTPITTSTIAVGAKPAGISVNPLGTKVYVANSGNTDNINPISVIDVASSAVTPVALSSSALAPFGISVSPDGTKVITSNWAGNKASVIDAGTNLIIAEPAVGNNAMSLGNFAGPVRFPVTTTVTTQYLIGTGGVISPPAGQVTMGPESITPSGSRTSTLMVGSGQAPTLGIAANTNFAITGVDVNGTAKGVVSSVTLDPVVTGAQTVTATFGRTQWPVNIIKTGTGTGNIVSSVAGINCGTACTSAQAVFPNDGSNLYLTFSADASLSKLISWGGACSGSTTSLVCTLTMSELGANLQASLDGTFNVTVEIAAVPGGPVRIVRGATSLYFQTLQDAYNAAVSGDIIDIIIGDYTLAANRSISVTLVGGWTDNTYPGITGASNIINGLTIAQGGVAIGSNGGLGAIVIK